MGKPNMPNTAGFLAYEFWTVPGQTWTSATVGSPPQTPELSLVVRAIIAQADVDKPVTLWVSLEDSAVQPGSPMQDNKSDARGYFQDRVDVTMTLGTPNSNQPVRNFLRTSDGPTTYSGTGSVSSSATVSVSGNAGVGFFDDVPTGSLGGGVASGNTYTFGRSLADFEVINDSDSRVIRHSYVMSESKGGPYDKPEDLVPSLSFTEMFHPINLHELPALATDNLPILSQAAWQSSDNNGVKQGHTLYIYIKQHLTWVTATNQFVRVDSSYLTAASEWTFPLYVPFEHLDVKTL
jgi:hypothetical protein